MSRRGSGLGGNYGGDAVAQQVYFADCHPQHIYEGEYDNYELWGSFVGVIWAILEKFKMYL